MLADVILSGRRVNPFTFWLRQLCSVLAWTLMLCLPGLVLAQQNVLPVPALTARVIDQTGTLTEADKSAMEAKLAAYEQSKGSQIVVLMVSTTQPEDIASYAYRVASTWKIGRRDVGDGVLLVVAKDDRRMRIEVAKKLEGVLPDLAAARILDQTMRPQFRYENYAGGISAALDQIMKTVDGETLPPVMQTPASSGSQGIDWMMTLVLVVMTSLLGGTLLKNIMGRGMGSVATGALTGGLIFLLSGLLFMSTVAGVASFVIALLVGLGGGSGGGGGSSGMRGGGRTPIIISGGPPFGGGWGGGDLGGGGGFGSGGGGDFGGGGASGDW